MSDIIHLLPDSVANQIAAGEVIQRPSSVIKELVENAIDADATLIQVYVTEAGKSVIQVSDNGKGMSETDARLAFERHSTSKISAASDLFALQTMGFRGEALASIAAVAQIELKTKMADSELGTSIVIHGGKLKDQQLVACPVGANFVVKNLFFNIPARRKFLKSNQTELSNIIQEFERIALAHPDIAFKLYSNDTLMMELDKGNFRQRIYAIFGKKLDQQLLPLDIDTELGHISGFVGMPESSKKKGCKQFFFVNGRFMRHAYFAKAVLAAYDRLIPEGEQVPYFINFKVNPETIDVNIHPTKTEIKFQDEQTFWQIILAAVREALAKFSAVPMLDFDMENKPEIPAFNPGAAPQGVKLNIDKGYNPFSDSAPLSRNWQDAYEKALGKSNAYVPDTPAYEEELIEQPFIEPIEVSRPEATKELFDTSAQHDFSEILSGDIYYFQSQGKYIVMNCAEGLLIINQQRAHIRILYDDYLSRLKKNEGVSQGLLFPQIIEFSPSQMPFIQELLPVLASVGFDLSEQTPTSFEIKGIPSGTEGLNPLDLLTQIIDEVLESEKNLHNEFYHKIAFTLAKFSAMPIGEVLSEVYVKKFLQDLFAKEMSKYTPDGKPIYFVLPVEQMDKILDKKND